MLCRHLAHCKVQYCTVLRDITEGCGPVAFREQSWKNADSGICLCRTSSVLRKSTKSRLDGSGDQRPTLSYRSMSAIGCFLGSGIENDNVINPRNRAPLYPPTKAEVFQLHVRRRRRRQQHHIDSENCDDDDNCKVVILHLQIFLDLFDLTISFSANNEERRPRQSKIPQQQHFRKGKTKQLTYYDGCVASFD